LISGEFSNHAAYGITLHLSIFFITSPAYHTVIYLDKLISYFQTGGESVGNTPEMRRTGMPQNRTSRRAPLQNRHSWSTKLPRLVCSGGAPGKQECRACSMKLPKRRTKTACFGPLLLLG